MAIRRAQEIQRAADPDHPAYVNTLNLVAQQLWFEGRLPDSKDASERALALAERTLRPEHPTLARTMRYLAGTLADLGDLSRSHALRERALRIGEREFGPDHYETAVLRNSVGHVGAGARGIRIGTTAVRARHRNLRLTAGAGTRLGRDGTPQPRDRRSAPGRFRGGASRARPRDHSLGEGPGQGSPVRGGCADRAGRRVPRRRDVSQRRSRCWSVRWRSAKNP